MTPTRRFSGVIKRSKSEILGNSENSTLVNSTLVNSTLVDSKSENSTLVGNSVLVSILIPTHNRDITTTLRSIADTKIPFKYEILLNDDSGRYNKQQIRDFERIFDLPKIKFFRIRQEDLSGIYKHLFRQATGKYLYYLEDDDFLIAPFTQAIKTMETKGIDLMYCNYFGYENPVIEFNKTEVFKDTRSYSLEFTNTRIYEETTKVDYTVNSEFIKFCETYNHYDNFQLGRFIFKKSICKLFPRTNNVLNDWFLFKHLRPQVFATSEYIIYKQNVNGDNISFNIEKPFYKCEDPLMVDLSLPYYKFKSGLKENLKC